jgi:hypothetical protein
MANCAKKQSHSHTFQWLPLFLETHTEDHFDCPTVDYWHSVAQGAAQWGPELFRHVCFCISFILQRRCPDMWSAQLLPNMGNPTMWWEPNKRQRFPHRIFGFAHKWLLQGKTREMVWDPTLLQNGTRPLQTVSAVSEGMASCHWDTLWAQRDFTFSGLEASHFPRITHCC